MNDGIDRCRVGFLPKAYVPHAKLWDGVLCQVVFVGSADDPSSVVRRKCHHYCGYARVAVISALPGGAKVFEDKYEAMMGERDKRVVIKREKIVDKSGTKFLSSSKEQVFTYEITIRNNKKDAAEIMVKDQYPIRTDKEIEVELLQSDKAAVNAETGILTWQLKLAPGETKKVRISYRIKYPKDKVIENL